ncbi:MAG TPA: 2-C-methyl-D-erythritol 4-phosphate cytidylyltransferase [Gammaproteobacteria bacterium]
MSARPAPRHWLVIPAAGSGRRIGGPVPKQYLELAGQPLLAHTLRCFVGHPALAGIVVVLAAGDSGWEALDPALRAAVGTVPGGAERSDSVAAGLAALADRAAADDWVLVHDAARPCLRRDDLDRLLATLADDPVGGILAVPVRDTMKRADAGGGIAATVARDALWHAQTPQMFRYGLLREALARAAADGVAVTDEAQAVERLGRVPRLVAGHADNLKITRPEDLPLAAFHLARQQEDACASATA